MRIVNVHSTPELNGEEGTIVKWDEEKQRWILKMDSTGKGKGIKTENLEKIVTTAGGTKLVGGSSADEA